MEKENSSGRSIYYRTPGNGRRRRRHHAGRDELSCTSVVINPEQESQ